MLSPQERSPMKNRALRICAIAMAAFLVLGVLFYFVAGDSLHYTSDTTETVSPKATLGELTQGEVVTQSIRCEFDTLETISLTVGTMARTNRDTLQIELIDAEGKPVLTQQVDTATMKDNSEFLITLPEALTDVKGSYYTLRLTSLYGTKGNAITLYYGNSVDTGRVDVPVEIEDTDALYLNGERKRDEDGNLCGLCLKVSGVNYHWFGPAYWWIFAGAAVLFALFLGYLLYCYTKQRKSLVLGVILSLIKYNFLIRQLVARDFKTKYKRSVLGMLWSFLNPLLTMSIQYVVFSTLFKSSIPNFAIYLLSGIICFNFFNEATGMCLMSIVGNATLINKVYVPKYIYPFSRTLSSCINLLLSLVPLLLMLLITRTPITPTILLLPFVLLMLFMLSYGVGLILASMMVFFRDTQFLWGIFSMLLMYLTPVFYPETIIPAQFLTVYKLNPLYHILRFMRSILIDGVSLEPKAYLYCIILCTVPLLLGVLIFRKNQNKFVLNI